MNWRTPFSKPVGAKAAWRVEVVNRLQDLGRNRLVKIVRLCKRRLWP